MKYKIIVQVEKCIGCGSCVAVCNNWQLSGGKAKPKKTTIEKKELKANKEAADVCPVQCIEIVEIK